MTGPPRLPPLYRLVIVPPDRDVGTRAMARAESGAEPATLLWAERSDRLEAAVILSPDMPLVEASEVLLCGALGLGDALAALVAPGVDVEFAWPGFVLVNARAVGGVGLRAPGQRPDAVPEWLVLRLALEVEGGPDSAVLGGVEVTTLEHEGCGTMTTADLVSEFARNFLSWVTRWQDDGFAPVRKEWIGRAHRNVPQASFDLSDGERVEGRFAGLDDHGAARIETAVGRREVPIIASVGR